MSEYQNNEWVETQAGFTKTVLRHYKSTADKRLVFYTGNNVRVLPLGEHIVVLGVQAVGHVSMVSKPVEEMWERGLSSKDGIAINAQIRAVLRVHPNDSSISRVALNTEMEKRKALDLILGGFQKACLQIPYGDLVNKVASLATEIVPAIEASLADQSSLALVSLVLLKFEPADRRFAAVHLERQQSILKRELDQRRHEERKIYVDRESELHGRQVVLDNKRAEDKRKADAEMNIARREQEFLDAENALKIKMKEIDAAKAIAAVFNTEGGLWALNPEAAKEIQIAKIQSNADGQRQLTQLMSKVAQSAGTLNQKILLGIAERQIDVNLTTEDVSDDTKPTPEPPPPPKLEDGKGPDSQPEKPAS